MNESLLLLFTFPFLFLLLFLLFLTLLQELLEIIHHLLIGQHSELNQQFRIAFFHYRYEFHCRGVVKSVSVHVDVDQSRVLAQHFFNFFNYWDFF